MKDAVVFDAYTNIERLPDIWYRQKEHNMKHRLYVDGNTVYGIDEECLIYKRQEGRNYANQQDLDALWARYQEEEKGENSTAEENGIEK